MTRVNSLWGDGSRLSLIEKVGYAMTEPETRTENPEARAESKNDNKKRVGSMNQQFFAISLVVVVSLFAVYAVYERRSRTPAERIEQSLHEAADAAGDLAGDAADKAAEALHNIE